jgi:hypothetical protein
MTEQEKLLANAILDREFSPFEVVKLYVDHIQSGSITNGDNSHMHIIHDEFERRVLKVDNRYVYSHHIESLLRTFFWTMCRFEVDKYSKAVIDMALAYPRFTDEDWVSDYTEWVFNLTDTIMEATSMNYSWMEIDEDCGCDENEQ